LENHRRHLNPAPAFAMALGKRAKTDPIDAVVIAISPRQAGEVRSHQGRWCDERSGW
jgi:hypothetical protein